MEHDRPVVITNVPVTIDRDYVNTKQTQSLEPIHTLNEPLYENLPYTIEYETPVVNDNVPVATGTIYVNTKLKETQQVEPIHVLNESQHDMMSDDYEYMTTVVNEPIHTLNDPQYNNLSDNIEYGALLANNNVPETAETTETNYVNMKLKETEPLKPKNTLSELLYANRPDNMEFAETNM